MLDSIKKMISDPAEAWWVVDGALFALKFAPAGAVTHKPVIKMLQGPSSSDSYVFMARAMLCQVAGPMTVAAPFDMGSGRWFAGKLASTTDVAPNAIIDQQQYTSSVSGGTYGLSSAGGLIVDGTRYTPAIDCVVEVTCVFEAQSSGTAWDSARNLACFAVPYANTSGGVSYTPGGANQRGLMQSPTTSRAAFALKSVFSVNAGVDYEFGLDVQNNPFGVTITVWNLRITLLVMKR
jgi:hypothetical protein